MAKGATVVTPNRRLSQELHLQFHKQASQNRSVWRSPDVLPLRAWLARLWDGLETQHGRPTLLSDTQARAWWDRELHRWYPALLQTAGASRRAYQGWQLTQDFLMDLEDLQPNGAESEGFQQWTRRYRAELKDRDWIDPAGLPRVLAETVTQCGERNLVFAGFDRFSPALTQLMQQLSRCGCTVDTWMPQLKTGQVTSHRFADTDDEYAAMGRFCHNALVADKDTRIGIVVPDLKKQRSHLEQALLGTLAPMHLFDETEYGYPFHFAEGKPLADSNLIQAALWLLQLADRDLDYDELLALLRSPFIGTEAWTCHRRIQLERAVRRSNRYAWDMAGVVSLLIEHDLLQNQRPLALLEPKQAGGTAYGNRWGYWCAELLGLFGWPNGAALKSRHQPLLQHWSNTVDQVVARDVVLGEVSRSDFLSTLRRRVLESRLKQRVMDVPVQVVSVEDAAGLYFDQVWFCGLHDEAWPQRRFPNPFLSQQVRVAFGLPGDGGGSDHEHAVNVHRRILGCSPRVVLSHPERLLDEPLRASPLLASLPLTQWPDANNPKQPRTLVDQMLKAGQLESVADVAPGFHKTHVSGGSSLLRSQSACPFQAFAKYRLGADEPALPTPGFNPMQRGIFVHEACHQLWLKIKDSDGLHALSDDQLTELVHQTVTQVLSEALQNSDVSVQRLAELEIERVKGLVQQQLALEKQRPAFKVIASERSHDLEVSGLTLKLRMDRVDQSQGQSYLIDYKTGAGGVGQWLGERPDQPQMLAYAKLYPDKLGGLVFAKIKIGGVSFAGVTREVGVFPGVNALAKENRLPYDNWEGMLTDFSGVIDRLARDFKRGVADIDPQPNACGQCHLQGLCRVNQQSEVF